MKACTCSFPRACKDGTSGIWGDCKCVITDAEGRPINDEQDAEEESVYGAQPQRVKDGQAF